LLPPRPIRVALAVSPFGLFSRSKIARVSKTRTPRVVSAM
jgi:hypothetical protein